MLSSVRLDDPQALAGDVGQFDVSPDGQFGVYIADAMTDHLDELYSVDFTSGETRQLSLELDGSVVDFVVSPDSRHVVYRAQQPTGPLELYSVAIAGGEPRRLNGPLVGGGNVEPERFPDTRNPVLPYQISPNGHRVVYLADQETDDDFELFSVPIQGGTVTRLNERPSRFEGVGTAFQISPDSEHVVYWVDRRSEPDVSYSTPLTGGVSATLTQSALFDFDISPDSRRVVFWRSGGLQSIPIVGGESTTLYSAGTNDAGAPRIESDTFQISPDSRRVAFRLNRSGLHSVGMDGRGLVKITDVVRDDQGTGFRFTPDSQHIVFVSPMTSGRYDALFRSSIFGGPRKSLSNTVGPDWHNVRTDFQISPGGGYVVYGEGGSREAGRLFSAPIAGSRQFRLDIEGELPIDAFHMSADGRWVTYSERLVETAEIYSVPLQGGDSVKLNGELAARGTVTGFLVSPDSSRVVYRGHEDRAGVTELYGVPIAGGDSNRLSLPLTALGDTVSEIQLSPGGDYVVYRADHDTDDVFELYSVEVATGAVTKLNEPLVDFGEVQPGFQFSADGGRVVYQAGEHPSVVELLSVPIAGGESTRLSSEPDNRTLEFRMAPDGERVVFTAIPPHLGGRKIYSVPLGGGNATLLTPADVGGTIYEFQVSADSSRVVYTADHILSARPELFSVPIDGGEIVTLNSDDREEVQHPATSDLAEVGIARQQAADETVGEITPSTLRPGRVEEFLISPDSRYVVYRGDQDFDNKFDLYSIPIDGGEDVKLAESIAVFQISSDSRHVVMYDDLSYDKSELLSVQIDGGTVTRLSSSLATVWPEFALSPDGKWATFVGAEEYFGSSRLYGIGVTGGDLVQLNDSTNRSSVRSGFQFTADSRRVVYRTNQTNWRFDEVRSVPITGGAPVRHSDPIHDVAENFVLSSDGGTILYLAEPRADGGPELYSVPFLGGDARQVNGPLAPGGGVTDQFAISEDGAHAIYLADEDIDEQFGIYRAELPPDSGFAVTSFEPDSSGFTIQFSTALNRDVLNIFDTETAVLGPSDLLVEGASTGVVRGSFVVDRNQLSGRFIKSGGPLIPDTYTVSLRSGGNSFKSDHGVWLGAVDNQLADDFAASFTVSQTSRVVSLPDFVRGPGQPVNVPVGSRQGIPLSVSDGAGLQNATLEVRYDPSLLSITAVTLGDAMPGSAVVSLDTSTSDTAVMTFRSPVDLPAGTQVLLYLVASVPAELDGSYGRPQLLQLVNLDLTDANGNSLPAVGDSALHVASFFGDVTGNGRIDTSDASKIARVAAEMDPGFAATPLVDPWITADLTGNGIVNASDALRLLQLLVQPLTLGTSTPGTFFASTAGRPGEDGQSQPNRPNTGATEHSKKAPGRMAGTSHRSIDAAMRVLCSDREHDEGQELLELGVEAAVDELLAVPERGR